MKPKTEKNSVFIICSVRKADEATKMGLVAYKQKLESEGYKVHLPHMDTNQIKITLPPHQKAITLILC